MIRRPALVVKNETGIYDKVEIYKSKKETIPFVTLTPQDNRKFDVLDTYKIEGTELNNNRYYTLLELPPDGSKVRVYLSNAFDTSKDNLFYPKSLYKDILEHVGYVPAIPTGGGTIPENVENVMLPCWENYTDWQARALNYLIKEQNYEIVFCFF